MANELSHEIVIIGGGTAGITVAAQLARKIEGSRIAIIDPSSDHYYQPLWTLVGAGIVHKEDSKRDEKSLIPRGVHFIQEAVSDLKPDRNVVETKQGSKISYKYLVICPGMKLYWDAIPGLQESIGKGKVVSNYDYEYSEKTWEALQQFDGGNMIFTQPNTPIKCGAAPQKVMYLSEEYCRNNGLRDKTNIMFYAPIKKLFPVPKYEETINRIVEERDIETHLGNHLIEIRPEEQEAVFENVETKETETVHYDFMHVTPPMGPHDFLKDNPVSDSNGYVDVDKNTLHHNRYDNIFSLGDAAGIPVKRSGAAVRKEAPVVVGNLLSLMSGKPMKEEYKGYSSCPLITSRGKVMLAEFNYENVPVESFPFDQSTPSRAMYFLKKEMLPRIYWYGMLKGYM